MSAGSERVRKWRQSHPEQARAMDSRYKARKAKWAANRHRRNSQLVRDYKEERGCLICNERDPYALDLHHAGSDKDADVSRMIKRSLTVLLAEIAKCVVLCANCHRKFHAGTLEIPEHARECLYPDEATSDANP